jgi:hypothetical protein
MSIRLIAQELYRLHRVVAALEAQLTTAPLPEKERLVTELRRARSDYRRVQQALEGHKQG